MSGSETLIDWCVSSKNPDQSDFWWISNNSNTCSRPMQNTDHLLLKHIQKGVFNIWGVATKFNNFFWRLCLVTDGWGGGAIFTVVAVWLAVSSEKEWTFVSTGYGTLVVQTFVLSCAQDCNPRIVFAAKHKEYNSTLIARKHQQQLAVALCCGNHQSTLDWLGNWVVLMKCNFWLRVHKRDQSVTLWLIYRQVLQRSLDDIWYAIFVPSILTVSQIYLIILTIQDLC